MVRKNKQSGRESAVNKPFAVADCETDPFKMGRIPTPFAWGFYDGSEYATFDNTHDFVDYIRDYDGVIYAHNGGKFDWHFLKDYLEPDTNIMLINGRISKVKIGAAELRDSWNILPVPLGAYQKDDIDYAIMEKGERDKPKNKKLIADYLRGDCVYLWNLVNAFRDRHGPVLTQAGAAMKSYKRIIGDDIPQSTREYYDQFKPFYYGGRVQCFERGVKKELFDVYDINSAYPAAMLKPHPASLTFFSAAPTVENLQEFVNKHPTSCVKLDCISGGHLPWREDIGKKIHYPNDGQSRTYQVTGHELIVSLEFNLLRDIKNIRAFYWSDCRDFSEFILPLYEERQEAKRVGNKEADILAKLEMNSLYGKFGSDPRRYKAYKLFSPDCLGMLLAGQMVGEKRDFELSGDFGNLLLGEAPLTEVEERFYNVATALSITGAVRAFMARSILSAERVLYCDTDSLALVGGHDLDLGNELGQWGNDGTFKQWAIAGRKLYAFEYAEPDPKTGDVWKVRSKGVRLSWRELVDVASGGEVKYNFEAPTFAARKEPYFTSRTIRQEKS